MGCGASTPHQGAVAPQMPLNGQAHPDKHDLDRNSDACPACQPGVHAPAHDPSAPVTGTPVPAAYAVLPPQQSYPPPGAYPQGMSAGPGQGAYPPPGQYNQYDSRYTPPPPGYHQQGTYAQPYYQTGPGGQQIIVMQNPERVSTGAAVAAGAGLGLLGGLLLCGELL